MIAVMRFTYICRLFGIGSEAPSAQHQEDMECRAATPDLTDDITLSQHLTGEDGLSEEDKVKRRAERRRAKKKRRRERRKQMKSESTEQDAEDGDDDACESEEEDDSVSDAEMEEEEGRRQYKAVMPRSKEPTISSPSPSGTIEPQKNTVEHSEEEPEWDVSSAFFANAASHIRPKRQHKDGRKCKENKEDEALTKEVDETDAVIKMSASLTEKGIKLVQEGQYAQAVHMFTEAIKYDPKDYRFFGNRSYCYGCLQLYPQALADAEMSIQLAPDWPKGHFRKGSALMGMKRYSEVEKAMEQVLVLDEDCEEAVNDLFNCKVLQLMELGFEENQSVLLLDRFATVQAVLASPEASRVVSQDNSLGISGSPGLSLWVGNVKPELTEKHLRDLFQTYGEIESMRVLHDRTCAFVNFKKADMAAVAMEKLNGYCIENTTLLVRYQDRRTPKVLPLPLMTSLSASQQATSATSSRRRGPVNGDECYFWRTTGCHFGEKCHFKHIPEQKGMDRLPWQP
ncbi:hypothetical protein DPEC_G00033300 [Dallia pectoralis]|uniref:Uncharacterized protein n=1 Tax=Dallia pectoralis TaxID=75939 RepID=A0ACC2HDH6_DALPE|nr:hypothetical protein DPEC_G00033300 [Dallia pectoralis]